jgi:hypothetical protein
MWCDLAPTSATVHETAILYIHEIRHVVGEVGAKSHPLGYYALGNNSGYLSYTKGLLIYVSLDSPPATTPIGAPYKAFLIPLLQLAAPGGCECN